jgi:hypothetical protein
MKRAATLLILGAFLVLGSALVHSQQLYERESLDRLGLTEEESQLVMQTVRDSAAAAARLSAELNIKKAELARLLLDDDPNERQIERVLRESAEIEVELRMLEIRRELAIRDIVGTERWTAILRNLRNRPNVSSSPTALEVLERIQSIQSEFRNRQSQLIERLRTGNNPELAEAITDQLRRIEQQYRELVETLRRQ